MTDRELLELAAKAAGYVIDSDGDRLDDRENGGAPKQWRPLTDDGDALRLAVKLGILDLSSLLVTGEGMKADPCAAIRRAIVHAAAEVGKGVR